MFPVATTQSGMCNAPLDTCNTPAPPAPSPVPLPYPNQAMLMQATPSTCSKKVKVLAMPVVVMTTKIPMTSLDEAGVAGGVVSGTIKGPAMFTKGSAKVMVEGTPVVFHTCTTGHNGSAANAPVGVHDTPSQAKVMVSM